MKTARNVMQDFFKSVLLVISRNSSKSYGIVVFQSIKKKLSPKFQFLKFVNISDSTIIIDSKINSAEPKEIKKLIDRIIVLLGPDMLRIMVRENMDTEDINYLNRIGVRI